MEDSQYTLEKREGEERPWVIVRPDGSESFTFDLRDEGFANEILKNLNTGTVWAPTVGKELAAAVASESLEGTDDLVASA